MSRGLGDVYKRQGLTASNRFYIHKDDEGEIAINTSLIHIIEFSDEDDNKRGAGLVSNR